MISFKGVNKIMLSMCVIDSLICNQNDKLHVLLTILLLLCTFQDSRSRYAPAHYAGGCIPNWYTLKRMDKHVFNSKASPIRILSTFQPFIKNYKRQGTARL